MDRVGQYLGPADVPARAHVYVERLDDAITIAGDDGHHLARVRRLRAGEIVTAADGYGRWRAYAVGGVDAGAVALRATADFAHEVPLVPALTVAFALTKGERPELAVQKLTELGADEIVLLRSARSVVRWGRDREDHAIDRLRRVAREAGAQCRRARLPVIDGLVPVTELVGRPGLVLADHDGNGADSLPEPPDGKWVVAVGPEGGFDETELDSFAGAPRLAVGSFVLRAETAAIASAAALAWRRSHPA
jgi:16S rRNA (uracil1498-N3)-methyltransferase